MPREYKRAARLRQANDHPVQLALPLDPVQLELPLEPETSKRLERFEDFLLRLHDAYSSPNPNISRFTRAIERNADHD